MTPGKHRQPGIETARMISWWRYIIGCCGPNHAVDSTSCCQLRAGGNAVLNALMQTSGRSQQRSRVASTSMMETPLGGDAHLLSSLQRARMHHVMLLHVAMG